MLHTGGWDAHRLCSRVNGNSVETPSARIGVGPKPACETAFPTSSSVMSRVKDDLWESLELE